MSKTVVVAGGGFRGIISACLLVKRGLKVTLVERAPFLGAVLWPFEWERYGLALDKGCHLFGSGDQANDDLILEILDGNHQSHEMRVASVYNATQTPNTAVPDLSSLSREDVAVILSEIIQSAARHPDVTGAGNLADALEMRFGATAARHLNRMCEKVSAAAPADLSPAANFTTLGMRIKIADDGVAELLKQIGPLDDRIAATNAHDPYKYLESSNPKIPHRHFYPKEGGTGAFPRAAKRYLESNGCEICLGAAIEEFAADDNGVSLRVAGRERQFDHMIWALDTGLLSQIALGEDLTADKVHKTPMGLFYFLTPAEEIGGLSYLQNYDPDDLTFRVSSAGRYSNQSTSDGNSYICSEVVTEIGSEVWETPEAYAQQVWAEARRFGMVQSEAPLDVFIQKTPVSYKHEKVGFEDAFRTVEAEIARTSARIVITDPMVLGYLPIIEMLDAITAP